MTKGKKLKTGEKIDLWMTTCSEVVGHNLAPLFEFWGLPLTDAAKAVVSELSPYFPDDITTREYGPKHAAVILEKYPSAVRVPEKDPDTVPDLDELLRVRQKEPEAEQGTTEPEDAASEDGTEEEEEPVDHTVSDYDCENAGSPE